MPKKTNDPKKEKPDQPQRDAGRSDSPGARDPGTSENRGPPGQEEAANRLEDDFEPIEKNEREIKRD